MLALLPVTVSAQVLDMVQEGVIDDLLAMADGRLLAISEDGAHAVVASFGEARAYTRSGDRWIPVGEHPTPATGGGRIAPAIDAGGSVIVLGAPETGARGNARYFVRTTVGADVAYTNRVGLPPTDREGDAEHGFSVDVSADGSVVAVGAPGDAFGGVAAGVVRVYTCTRTPECTLDQILVGPARANDDRFGHAVALAPDGDTLVVGVPGSDRDRADAGQVEVFDRSGVWAHSQTLEAPASLLDEAFGSAVATDGTQLLVGSPNYFALDAIETGRVIAFARDGGSFGAGVTIGEGPTAGARYGIAIAIARREGRAIVGADLGHSVEIFAHEAGAWVSRASLFRPASRAGAGVGIDARGERVLIGMPAETGGKAISYLLFHQQGQPCDRDRDCERGHCTDGVCCEEACGNECEACSEAAGGSSDGRCTGLTASVASTVVCRPAAGVCDREETCAPSDRVCPIDLFSTEECRPATRPCDAAERCVFGFPDCPPDVPLPAGRLCRDPVLDPGCDLPDFCDGESFECEDTFHVEGTPCAGPRGPCDTEDRCDGAGTCVPQVLPEGTVCNAAVLDVCDTPDVCNGVTIDCPAAYLADVECRPAAGTCDAPEFCSGDSPSCPPDAVESAGMVCRESSAACDPSEQCDGASGACPADVNSCEPSDDAGVVDAALHDGGPGADTGAPVAAAGCGCRAVRASDAPFAFLLLALTCRQRRRSG